MDKSKFTERPGDSEGFVAPSVSENGTCSWCGNDQNDCERCGHVDKEQAALEMASLLLDNPRGWQDVDGVILPKITWAALRRDHNEGEQDDTIIGLL